MEVGDMIQLKNIPKDISAMWELRNGCAYKVQKMDRYGRPHVKATVLHDSNNKGKKEIIMIKETEYDIIEL